MDIPMRLYNDWMEIKGLRREAEKDCQEIKGLLKEVKALKDRHSKRAKAEVESTGSRLLDNYYANHYAY